MSRLHDPNYNLHSLHKKARNVLLKEGYCLDLTYFPDALLINTASIVNHKGNLYDFKPFIEKCNMYLLKKKLQEI